MSSTWYNNFYNPKSLKSTATTILHATWGLRTLRDLFTADYRHRNSIQFKSTNIKCFLTNWSNFSIKFHFCLHFDFYQNLLNRLHLKYFTRREPWKEVAALSKTLAALAVRDVSFNLSCHFIVMLLCFRLTTVGSVWEKIHDLDVH